MRKIYDLAIKQFNIQLDGVRVIELYMEIFRSKKKMIILRIINNRSKCNIHLIIENAYFNETKVKKHLKILLSSGLVYTRRYGNKKKVYYHINKVKLERVIAIFDI